MAGRMWAAAAAADWVAEGMAAEGGLVVQGLARKGLQQEGAGCRPAAAEAADWAAQSVAEKGLSVEGLAAERRRPASLPAAAQLLQTLDVIANMCIGNARSVFHKLRPHEQDACCKRLP